MIRIASVTAALVVAFGSAAWAQEEESGKPEVQILKELPAFLEELDGQECGLEICMDPLAFDELTSGFASMSFAICPEGGEKAGVAVGRTYSKEFEWTPKDGEGLPDAKIEELLEMLKESLKNK